MDARFTKKMVPVIQPTVTQETAWKKKHAELKSSNPGRELRTLRRDMDSLSAMIDIQLEMIGLARKFQESMRGWGPVYAGRNIVQVLAAVQSMLPASLAGAVAVSESLVAICNDYGWVAPERMSCLWERATVCLRNQLRPLLDMDNSAHVEIDRRVKVIYSGEVSWPSD